MYVTGGRGGDVYHVTNLSDSGVGSLRYGVTTSSGLPRTIVFDVSGTIELTTELRVNRGAITIAGQTAPGKGINLKNYGMIINSPNTVTRHIRVRPGDAAKGTGSLFSGDSLNITASQAIVDHVSTSWGIDENLSCAGAGFSQVSVQYCVIAEGLAQTGLYHDAWNADYNVGGPKSHSMGSLIKPISGSGVVSYHHNLWTLNGNRNPALGTYTANDTLLADIRNNVMFNNRNNGYTSEESLWIHMNYVGNYVIAGPATDYSWRYQAFDSNAANNVSIYQSGNLTDGDRDLLRDGTDRGWLSFSDTYVKATTPFAMATVTTQTADDAYESVMAGAGAFPWNRDSVDQRLFDNITNMTGAIINSQNDAGGYPVIPSQARAADWDVDGDGMPGWWEGWYGTNPAASDPNGAGAWGYTHLERYLEWILNPLSVCHYGDINADAAVNVGDLGILAANWGQAGRVYGQGDMNGDGLINVGDLGVLAAQWGWSGTAQPVQVPEPASLTALALGATALLRRRRVA